MTVCVAVKVNDCLVFAADSASSLVGTDGAGNPVVLKVFQHGNKVFNLYRGLPVCAMTCGMGNIGEESISTLAKDLRLHLKDAAHKYYIDRDNTLKELAEHAFDYFFNVKYSGLANKPAGNHSFEFWLGGYGSDGKSEVWRIQIINGACPGPELVMNGSLVGLQASGQPDAINRLVLGYSVQLPDALAAAGVPAAQIQGLVAVIAQRTQVQMVYPSMPVQDAIRLASFLVDTTKGYVSFIPGADTVGGSTDIAVVTKHEGFKWIQRKYYYPGELNPLEKEIDHA